MSTETKPLMTTEDLDRLRVLAQEARRDMLTPAGVRCLGDSAAVAADTIAALTEQNRELLGRVQEADATVEVLKACESNLRGYCEDYKGTIDEQREALEAALGAPSESYRDLLQRVRDLRSGMMSAIGPNVYTDRLSAIREAAGIAPGTDSSLWPGIIADYREKAQQWDAAQSAGALNTRTIDSVVKEAYRSVQSDRDAGLSTTPAGDAALAAIVDHVRAHDAGRYDLQRQHIAHAIGLADDARWCDINQRIAENGPRATWQATFAPEVKEDAISAWLSGLDADIGEYDGIQNAVIDDEDTPAAYVSDVRRLARCVTALVGEVRAMQAKGVGK